MYPAGSRIGRENRPKEVLQYSVLNTPIFRLIFRGVEDVEWQNSTLRFVLLLEREKFTLLTEIEPKTLCQYGPLMYLSLSKHKYNYLKLLIKPGSGRRLRQWKFMYINFFR